MVATIFEAKTNLSELIRSAQAGEVVVITSGREKTPVVQLTPVQPCKVQRLGFLEHTGEKFSESFWDPLPEGYDGYADVPNNPVLRPSAADDLPAGKLK